ncbi:pyridine nucleotide-disulfide oxidoreductase-like protein [Parathielavia appendiculata]|uniref:Pyridine nucleotide-disulfide oxidoreductase-like protein n=1 Tax=Parathielavia appendiculata TaxID=2587402 RepID=A0AAN6U377_9PEZI|nr:pyridine nucleotide-disulfide oxidoreductase-like protein [Parathielavia appendiculata]
MAWVQKQAIQHPLLSPRWLALSAIAAAVSGAALPRTDGPPATDFDAVIVGGGPAGLAALSGLARVRRKVLLIDSGEYRNAPTRHMHDVLGFDGVTPAYFRWAARQQLSHYTTVTMINGTVVKIRPANEQNTHFIVSSLNPQGTTETNITARKIVLATGLRDILPSTPGIRENWGQGIFWCPWCDGHEHADQPLGLLGSLDNVPAAVREMLTLNKDIIALVNGTDTPEFRNLTETKQANWQKYLQIHNVRVDNRTITRITRLRNGTDGTEDPSLPTVAEHDLFRVEFSEGDPVDRAAFLAAFPSEQTSKVGEEMGVQLWGGRLAANASAGLMTNVPGVYAVGDANSDNTTNVPHALFSGKRTAVFLHVRLAREDGERELNETEVSSDKATTNAASKRDLEHAARSLWETVNGEPGDILYAGEFDQ